MYNSYIINNVIFTSRTTQHVDTDQGEIWQEGADHMSLDSIATFTPCKRDIDSFVSDIQSSRLITNPPTFLGSLLISHNTNQTQPTHMSRK